MEKKQDNADVSRTDPEEGWKEKADPEEPEWFDEAEPEESVQADPEEPEWFDEAEQEDGGDDSDWSEEEKSGSGSDDSDWLDEEEPEDGGDDSDWLDEEEPGDGSVDPNRPAGERSDASGTEPSGPDVIDAEGESLAGIVASGMREKPVSDNTGNGGNDRPAPGRHYEEEAAAHTKKKKRRRRLIIGLCIIAAVIIAAYLGVGYYFTDHYLPGTVISGIECDYLTAEEVEDLVQEQVDQYEIQIAERGGGVETLRGVDFGLHLVYGDTLEEILRDQGPYLWPRAYFGDTTSHDLGRAVDWNEEKILTEINNLNVMDMDQMIDPTDAEILYSEDQGEYYIQPAEHGTHVQTAVVTEVIENAVSGLEGAVDLDEMGCYQEPNVTESSEAMVAACDKLNQMISADITYDMIDIENIHISKDQIREWIVMDDNYNISYDYDAIRAFVTAFAEQYDTRDKPHTLHTSWGGTATETNSGYGWQLDQEGEYETLVQELEEGATVVREPIWAHTAKSHGENDYGGTYVEVNLTRQHLYYYKNGEYVIDSDFVSGRMTRERVTDEGIYYVYYKQENAVLKGEDYETPVSYWMPFNGGEGLHDATWRGSFGGTIYMYSGSHGCINLPYNVAQTIYENISIGDCVFVYWEDGYTMDLVDDTGSSSSSSSGSGSSGNSGGSDSGWTDNSGWTDDSGWSDNGGETWDDGNSGNEGDQGEQVEDGSQGDQGDADQGGSEGGDQGGGDEGGGEEGGGDEGGGDGGWTDNGDQGGGEGGGEEGGGE